MRIRENHTAKRPRFRVAKSDLFQHSASAHELARSFESLVPDYDLAGVIGIDVEAVTPRAGHFQRCGCFEGDVSPAADQTSQFAALHER